MVESAYYLVSEDVLTRSGLEGQRYRTGDGRYVLNKKDLERVRLTEEELSIGLQGVEQVTEDEAMQQISFGGSSF